MDPLTLISILINILGSGVQAHYSRLAANLARRQLDLQEGQVAGGGEVAQLPPPPIPDTVAVPSWKSLLEIILLAEIPRQLSSINILSKASITQAVEAISANPSFRDRASRGGGVHVLDELHNPIDLTLSCERLLGFQDDALRRSLAQEGRPLVVAVPINMLAVSAIFFHLKDRFNLELNYHFPHAISLTDRLENDRYFRPDFCVVGVAPAVRMFSNQRLVSSYEFTMLMARCEQRVLAPNLPGHVYYEGAVGEGRYHVIRDRHSTQLFQEEHLEREGTIVKGRIAKENCDAHEAPSILAGGDDGTRVIAWSPHWQVLVGLDLAVDLGGTQGLYSYAFDSMLFFKRSLRRRLGYGKVVAMATAVRDAWYDLQSDPLVLRETVARMLDDATYVKELRRACGIMPPLLS